MKWLSLLLASAALAQTTTKVPAELAPYQKVSLEARIPGVVEKVLADRGSQVKQGDLLIALSAPDLAARIVEAEAKAAAIDAQTAEAAARLASAESTHERLKAAAATPGAVAANDIVLAAKQVEAARALIGAIEASARAARAQTKVLSELASYLNITAPFSGVVTARHIHPGALAHGPLLDIEQTARLRLVIMVPESEVAAIARGARLTFTVAAHPGRTFTCTVARPARALDAKTRTMPVEADVDNSTGALAPGMYAEVNWPVKR